MRISDWSSGVCSSDLMRRVDHDIAVGPARGHPPAPGLLVLRQLLEAVTHQHMVAARDDLVTRRVPHHAGAKPRIAEGFEQGLGRHAVIGLLVEPEAALQPVDHRAARSEEHTSELQSLMRISYAVLCLKKKKKLKQTEEYG